MLILLPILTFVILFLTLLGTQSSRHGVRAVLLQTSAFMGAYVVVISEGLSLFRGLTPLWVSITWLLPLLGLAVFTWKNGYARDGLGALRKKWKRPDTFNLIAGGILSILLILLFMVAFISPTNNSDSLFYHMSRVAHWAQNRSLAHYSTNYVLQLMHQIFSELLILQLRFLWGNDQLANLVQYFSFIGSIMSVTAIASLLGVGNRGQWLAAAFAFSIPSALLEATSTQNDIVAAFWLLALLYFVIYSLKKKLLLIDILCIGVILGLGLLTKATFYFYAILTIGYFCINRLVRSFTLKTVAQLALIGLIAAILNLGFWVRNQITFNSPFGQGAYVTSNISQLSNPGLLITGPIKILSQNFMTPDEEINASLIEWLHSTFTSLDPSMPQFDLEWGWNHEDLAGNPMHVILIFISLILLLILNKRVKERTIWIYLALVMGSIYLISVFTRDDVYGIRYQLPFFFAFGPIFGISVNLINKKTLSAFIIVMLLLSSLPWILFNRIRPLIAMRDSSDPFTIPCLAGCTTGSILNETSSNIIFGSLVEFRESYTAAAEAVSASGCLDVGLLLDSHDPEFLFWWLLDVPESGIRIETGTTIPELQRYVDPNFKPCTILCTICTESTAMPGYLLEGAFGGIFYYTKMDFQPEAGD